MNNVISLLVKTQKNDYVYGTGFFTTSTCIITCAHILDKYLNIYMFKNTKLYRLLVDKIDNHIDVAQLYSVEYTSPTFLEFYDEDDYGPNVQICGNYRHTGNIHMLEATIFSKHYVSYDNFDSIALNAYVSHGLSGGPLLFNDKVIGILSWFRNSSKNKDLNLCGGVASNVIKRFLSVPKKKRLYNTRSLSPHNMLTYSYYGEFVNQIYDKSIDVSVGDVIISINDICVGYNNVSSNYIMYMNDKLCIHILRKKTNKIDVIKY